MIRGFVKQSSDISSGGNLKLEMSRLFYAILYFTLPEHHFIGKHFLLNVDAAIDQIRGSAAHSPLVESRTQRELAMSVAYQWD